MFRIGFAELVCRLEPGTTAVIAHRFFECKSNFFSKRNWQEHSSHTDKDAMAARTRSSKTPTSCESSISIKSDRHVDRKPLEDQKLRNSVQRLDKLNFAQKHWTRNPKESRKSRKSSLQLKQLKWMKRSRTGSRTQELQRSRTSRKLQNYDGSILWIDFSKNCRNCWKGR